MSLGILVAIFSVLLLQNMSVFAIALITVIVLYFFFSPVASLSDSATIAMLGADKAMYGRVRIGGTIGWGLFALIAGAMINQLWVETGVLGIRIFFPDQSVRRAETGL